MRYIALSVIFLVACTDEAVFREYYGEPSIVGSDSNSVQIRSGFKVDPSKLAIEYCGSRNAVLDKTEITDQRGYYSISYFECT